MKYLSIIFILLLLGACSDNSEELAVSDAKLLEIEHENETRTWTETFNYDTDDRLVSIDNSSGIGSRKEFVYEGDKVIRINHLESNGNTVNAADSLTYNSANLVTSFSQLSAYPGPELAVAWTYEFEYDEDGRVSKQSTFFNRSGESIGYIIYEWTGNNISKLNYFDEEDELLYEYFYQYDNKNNYARGIVQYIDQPLYWNRNNITKFEYIDHTGLLDLACGPCTYEFDYTEDDYPSEIDYNWGYILRLTYE